MLLISENQYPNYKSGTYGLREGQDPPLLFLAFSAKLPKNRMWDSRKSGQGHD